MKLMNVKTFNALCASIGKATATLRSQIQEAAVVAVGYSILHRDITAGQRLLDSVSHHKTVRKDSLVAYLEKYGQFAWLKTDKKFAFLKREGLQFNAEYVEAMSEDPWVEAIRVKEPVSKYDVTESFAKWLKTAHKFADDAAVAVVHKDFLTEVERNYHAYLGRVQDEANAYDAERQREEVVIPAIKVA